MTIPEAAQLRGLSREQIQLLKNTICKGATDEELRLFAEVCQRKNLDPFNKQIHMVRRWDSTQRRETMTFQTAIDGLPAIAERSGRKVARSVVQNGRIDPATGMVHLKQDNQFFDSSRRLVSSLPFEALLPKRIAADAWMQELISRAKTGEAAPARP